MIDYTPLQTVQTTKQRSFTSSFVVILAIIIIPIIIAIIFFRTYQDNKKVTKNMILPTIQSSQKQQLSITAKPEPTITNKPNPTITETPYVVEQNNTNEWKLWESPNLFLSLKYPPGYSIHGDSAGVVIYPSNDSENKLLHFQISLLDNDRLLSMEDFVKLIDSRNQMGAGGSIIMSQKDQIIFMDDGTKAYYCTSCGNGPLENDRYSWQYRNKVYKFHMVYYPGQKNEDAIFHDIFKSIKILQSTDPLPVDPTANWIKYENSQLNFRLKYPDEWGKPQETEEKNDTKVTFSSLLEISVGKYFDTTGKEMTMEELEKKYDTTGVWSIDYRTVKVKYKKTDAYSDPYRDSYPEIIMMEGDISNFYIIKFNLSEDKSKQKEELKVIDYIIDTFQLITNKARESR